MPRKDPIDDALKRLVELRSSTATPEVRSEITKFLASKVNLIVAKAASVVATLRFTDLIAEMETAFARFLRDPGSDKGAAAKTSIANAIYELQLSSESVFLAGVDCIQYEPSYGGRQDVAGELRSICALGLATSGHRHALEKCATLLMDSDPQCRLAAARAIAVVGHESGALPLRVKTLAGDERVGVTEECFLAMMKLAPARSASFIASFLDSPDPDLQSAAAMALGASRRVEGLRILLDRWEFSINPAVRHPLISAIGLSRLPDALSFLLTLIETSHRTTALEALKSLTLYRHDETIRSRLSQIVRDRNEPEITQAFQELFPSTNPA